MNRKRFRITSPIKQKILLLLATGLVLGLTRSPRQYFKLLKATKRDWDFIDRRYLFRLIREFKTARLIDYHEDDSGEIKIVITEKGKAQALIFNPDQMMIKKPAQWDKKWRLVMFDIPEKKRQARDALRDKLREMNFKEFQQSIFVHPYPCADEINFIVEFFEIRPHVRLATVEKLTNEAELLLHFDLKKKL